MTTATEETVFDLYRSARAHLAAGAPREAVRALERAAELEPGDPAIERALAFACYRFAALGRAEELFRAVVDRDPGDAEAHHALGRTLVRRGRPEDARPHLKLAAAMDPRPEHVRAAEALGDAPDLTFAEVSTPPEPPRAEDLVRTEAVAAPPELLHLLTDTTPHPRDHGIRIRPDDRADG